MTPIPRRRLPSRLLPAFLTPTVLLACASGSVAQTAPRPAPGGTITISVDATDAPRKILHAKLTVPARPGPLTLLYPKWIPGEHGPTGPIINLAGLKLWAGGKPITWQRDSVNMYAFRCVVPAGASAVDVELDFLSPASTDGFSGGASATAQLADISWNQLLLYPQGPTSDSLTYAARLRLPPGWKYGTALPVASESGGTVEFKPVSLTTLVDSPIIAGVHFKKIDLGQGDVLSGAPSHEIDLVSDSAAALEMTPEQVAAYKRLVTEAHALFGARHYQGYRFLYTLSDRVANFGLEHHESSDDRAPERVLIDDTKRKLWAGLLPHEFVHSWNGKYRRPAGLTTPDFEQPMKGDLLWVYEGLTEYLGVVLTARSGLWSPADFMDDLAVTASSMEAMTGRAWRPLSDTTIAAQLLYGAPGEWRAWRRSVDFYPEGELIWLEADVLIREKTSGKKSLNDFCRKFHGEPSGAPAVKTYTFEDVVAGLNEVLPYDWKGFLLARLSSTAGAPLGGITAGGWKLVYNETPSDAFKAGEADSKSTNLRASIGLVVKEDATVADVVPGLAAAQAGLGPGMKVVAVGGRKYSADVIHDAVKATKAAKEPLEILAENGEYYKTYRLDYHGGERYPHLERDG